ncbi:MAG: pyridoxamine 5'-phosphate oxidase family protein [Betaproteobacteria bacterium]|nr:pyridoxamine 5'-phosphate oxidase family protein [Betaproteobacteria bacterium]
MDSLIEEHRITNVAALERLYGAPAGAAVEKEIDYIHPHYRALIAASPFVVLATGSPDGLDTSPRGDAAGFVMVEDEKTLLVPDRRGNNRVDSLPRLGTMLADISQSRINGENYDRGLYERLKAALY